MKVDYLVWLKSGSCVEGRAESEAVDSLISTWQSRSTKQRAFASLDDEDRTATYELSNIEAIAKNRPEEMKTSGF